MASCSEDARDFVMDKRDEEHVEVGAETVVRVEDEELRVAQTAVVDDAVQAISMAMGVSEVIGLMVVTSVVVAAGVMPVELET